MTHHAGPGKTDLQPTLRFVTCGRKGRFALVPHPRLKFFRRFRDQQKCHVRVLMTTKFRALAAKYTFLVRLKPNRRGMSWNQVAFPLNVWRPKTMDHIL